MTEKLEKLRAEYAENEKKYEANFAVLLGETDIEKRKIAFAQLEEIGKKSAKLREKIVITEIEMKQDRRRNHGK